MDKSGKLFKALKIIGIIAVIGLVVWYFESKESKRAANREDTYYSLQYFSEELASISNLAEEARWSEDYYEMDNALHDIQKRCDDLKEVVDRVTEKNKVVEPDYDESNRRSWWY
jgi:hypothetical protein